MRLVSCYVSGFGQIKDFAYDFKPGLDVIFQENGWGKTTFSVFLKAMFYGMENATKTKVLMERKHYLPWNGGNYGGSLVFEAGGKTYRVERTFGKTIKDDTFALTDTLTGMASTDYTENLGEELFEVDRESFEGSIFVPQSVLSTTMTDSLNAKMGNLASAKDDINNFDSALSRVVEARKNFTRKSAVNNGTLNIIKDELSKCNEIIDKKAAVTDGYRKQVELLEEKKTNLNWLEAEKNRVAELIREQSKREQDMGAYRQKLEFLNDQQEELQELELFFAKGVPDMSEQEAMEDVERQYDLSKRTEMDLALKLPLDQQVKKWEKLFVDGVPSVVDLEDWNKKATMMQELKLQGKHAKLSDESKKQLEELNHFFSKKMPTEEELSQAEKDVVELSKLDGRMVEQDENYRNLKAKKDMAVKNDKESSGNGSIVLLFALFAMLLVGGLVFSIFFGYSENSSALQILCYGGAAATFVAGVMQNIRIRSAKKNRREELTQQLADAQESLEQCRAMRQELADKTGAFLGGFLLTPADSMQKMVYEIRVNFDLYLRLKEEEQQATESTTGVVEEMADVRMELYTALDSYANVYEMDLYHEGCEAELLHQLKKDVESYGEYSVNKTQMELLCITMNKQEELLQEYCDRYVESSGNVSDKLKLIRSNLENYQRVSESAKKLQEEMKEFADSNQVPEDVVSVEELQKKQEQIDEEIQTLHKGITQDRETILSLGDELDAIEEAENRRDVLLEKRADSERKVELLTKTEEFLQMAKEQFLSRYMSPLRQGMGRYLKLLDEKYEEDVANLDYDITMDLSVRVMSNGSTHSSEYLSHGYQDLVALCARFALVDVLYQKERPMIVLDDPFTNLDEEKTTRALALLQEIAKDSQIIYFTCHKSRAI